MLGGAMRGRLPGTCLRHSGRLLNARRRLADAPSARPLQAACASNLALSPAEPGTVKPYYHHMFVELPGPEGVGPEAQASPWWPSVVEKEPALLRVFSRLAIRKDQIQGGANSHEP